MYEGLFIVVTEVICNEEVFTNDPVFVSLRYLGLVSTVG